MGGEWKEARLEDLITVTHGYAFKGEDFSEANVEGSIVVTIGNFDYTGGFRFESTKIKRCNSKYPPGLMISIESQVEAMGHGSTRQTELSRANLSVMPVISPPSLIQKQAEALLSEWAIKSEKNNNQNGSLTKLRDTLLPQLIAGELRIPDAEKLAEEALT